MTELVGEVLDTMRQLADEGMTSICDTHEMWFARALPDRVVFYHKSVIEEIDGLLGDIRQSKSGYPTRFPANTRRK